MYTVKISVSSYVCLFYAFFLKLDVNVLRIVCERGCLLGSPSPLALTVFLPSHLHKYVTGTHFILYSLTRKIEVGFPSGPILLKMYMNILPARVSVYHVHAVP